MPQFHTEAFLTPEARKAASMLPTRERQEMIKTLLYKYPVFKEGVSFIDTFHRPAGGDVHDTGCIGGLIGESRAGKTMICKYFSSLHPNGLGEGGETFPIVYVEATEQMPPTHLAERLFTLTGARSIPRMKSSALMDHAILRLAAGKTELVIIDDAHFLLCDRPLNQIKAARGFIKEMADANRFNILLVGEERLHSVVGEMHALANRGGFYHKTVEPMGSRDEEFEMFRLLLDKIDERLPFREKAGLSRVTWAKDFHHYSEGKIGRLMNLISRAAFTALAQDTTCIMVEHFRETMAHMRPANDRYPYFEKG